MSDSEQLGFDLVKLTRADWSGPSQYTVICSDHFNDDCYEVKFSYMRDFGIPVNKCLIKGSVPFIYPERKRDRLNEAFLHSPQHKNPPLWKAHAKRAKNMVNILLYITLHHLLK